MEPRISAADLYLRLGDDEVVVVDCRNADVVWGELQVPGALRMTPEEVALSGRVLPDDELIVLYGAARDLSDSGRAWRALLKLGRQAVCLDGGLEAWIRAGYPLEPCERCSTGELANDDLGSSQPTG